MNSELTVRLGKSFPVEQYYNKIFKWLQFYYKRKQNAIEKFKIKKIFFSRLSAVAHQRFHPQAVIQNTLSQPQVLRGHFQQLIICEELQALLETEGARRNQPQRLVRAGSTCIGQMLGAAYIHGNILSFRADTHHHAAVHLRSRCNKHCAALLRIPDTIGNGLAGFKGDQRTGIPPGDVSLVRLVPLEDRSQDSLALGIGQEFVPLSEKPARRYQEFHFHAVSNRCHLQKFTFACAQLFHN